MVRQEGESRSKPEVVSLGRARVTVREEAQSERAAATVDYRTFLLREIPLNDEEALKVYRAERIVVENRKWAADDWVRGIQLVTDWNLDYAIGGQPHPDTGDFTIVGKQLDNKSIRLTRRRQGATLRFGYTIGGEPGGVGTAMELIGLVRPAIDAVRNVRAGRPSGYVKA